MVFWEQCFPNLLHQSTLKPLRVPLKQFARITALRTASSNECPLWVINESFAIAFRMSAFGGKADMCQCVKIFTN